MKTFVFEFNNKLYKAQGKTGSDILSKTFTIRQLRKLKFTGYIEVA